MDFLIAKLQNGYILIYSMGFFSNLYIIKLVFPFFLKIKQFAKERKCFFFSFEEMYCNIMINAYILAILLC